MFSDKYKEYKTMYLQLKNDMIGGDHSNSREIKTTMNQSIDFDKLKTLKKLGAGVYGTTYLVEYNGKNYAQKIQHILPKDRERNYKNELWREFDLYDYINDMNIKDRVFFTNLHGYKIYKNCDHDQIQERPFKINTDKINKLDESSWCVTYLIDYKGDMTLLNFLERNTTLDHKLIYSIILQICKIIFVLYKGGYSHNDLHPGNIMINKTSEKYFEFMNTKIPYQGYQLTAIDYGDVLHKKFNIRYKRTKKMFLIDRKKWLFFETFGAAMRVLTCFIVMLTDCISMKKKLPWERSGAGDAHDNVIKKIIKNHSDFYVMVKDKYIKQYPLGEKLLNKVVEFINEDKLESINKIVNKKKHEFAFWDILRRIEIEFNVFFPEKYSKYWTLCTYYECMLPKDIMQTILLINNYRDFVDYFIKHIS